MKDILLKIKENSNQIIMELTSLKKENILENLKMENLMEKASTMSS